MAAESPPSLASRNPLGSDGAVRVFSYQCTARKGDRPQGDQFLGPSISFVRSGVFGFRSEQRTQLLTTGFMLLGNPGRCYEVSHDHGGGDCCVIFAFDEAVLDELAGAHPRRASAGYFAHSVLPPVPRIDALRDRVERALQTGAARLGIEELALEIAAATLAQTSVTRPPKLPPDSRSARDSVFAALSLLEQALAEPVHLGDLADEVGLSPYHFLRLFKREIGVTPYQFLVQARLRHAVRLLRDTERSVTDIAFEIGFGDLSNFINAFRRELGCSPTKFRKLGR
jgi:AraC family transcriptional regulator